MQKALMIASVASMIDLFNMDNIKILLDLGYNVDVICNFEYGSITSQKRVEEFKLELEKKGINAIHCPIPRSIWKINDILKSIKLVQKYKKNRQYDLVHCHSPIGGVISRIVFANDQNSHVIYTAHGFHFFNGAPLLNWLLYYPIEKFFSKYTDTLITINEEDYTRSKTFKANRNIYVHGIGINTLEIDSHKKNKKEKLKEFNFSNDDLILFSAGQLNRNKNHELVLRSIAKLNNNNIKYLLCGFGELENYLKNLADELNISNQVIFAGFRKDVKELLHIADIFIFPSLREGLSVALMESLAAGLPVICSKIRGNTDLIQEDKGGYHVSPYDIDKMSYLINKLADDEELRIKMGNFNKNFIKKFDIKNISNEMRKIYTSI